MKYCTKCGNELLDEAVICPKCGCLVEGALQPNTTSEEVASVENKQTLKKAAFVLNIITIIILVISAIVILLTGITAKELEGGQEIFITNLTMSIIYLLMLLYMIPMTVKLKKAISEKQPLSIAYKVCTLLFLNSISGILLLCDRK